MDETAYATVGSAAAAGRRSRAMQPRRGGFAAPLKIPCSASEQAINSLLRTHLGDLNSLFRWDRAPATVGLQSDHPTEITAVFCADDKMAARRIPCYTPTQ